MEVQRVGWSESSFSRRVFLCRLDDDVREREKKKKTFLVDKGVCERSEILPWHFKAWILPLPPVFFVPACWECRRFAGGGYRVKLVVKRGLARAVPEDGPSSFWRNDLALQQLTSVPGGWWFCQVPTLLRSSSSSSSRSYSNRGQRGRIKRRKKKIAAY